MRGGDTEGPVVVRDDFQAQRERERGATQQLVSRQTGTEIVVRGLDFAIKPGSRTEEAQAFRRTCLDAGFEPLGAGLGDVVGLITGRIIIDEVGQFVAEGDERPRQRAGHGVFVTQADLGTGVAFRAERQAEVRTVGEIVGCRRTISRADFGVREQLLGEAVRKGNLAGRLTCEIGEAIVTHGSAEAVGGGDLPIGASPDAEAFMRVRPGQAVRGDIELLEGRTLVADA